MKKLIAISEVQKAQRAILIIGSILLFYGLVVFSVYIFQLEPDLAYRDFLEQRLKRHPLVFIFLAVLYLQGNGIKDPYGQAACNYLLFTVFILVHILLYICYSTGIFSLTSGVVLMSFSLMGLIYVNERFVIAVATYMLLALLALGISGHLGLIPYAPMTKGLGWVGENVPLIFALGGITQVLPFVMVFFVMAIKVFGRWKSHEQELLRLATTDGLTRIDNRRMLLQGFQAEVQRAQRLGTGPVACILVDLDRFKQINDDYGHGMGDEVLVAVAATLKGSLREYDLLGRYGGEEFLLVLPSTDRDEALNVAERCRKAIEQLQFPTPGKPPLKVTGSFGLAFCVDAPEITIETIIQRADVALYQAKRTGRNKAVLFDQLEPSDTQALEECEPA